MILTNRKIDFGKYVLLLSFGIIFIAFSAVETLAANYPLKIVNIEGTGENNRIKYAYPGILYNVRIVAAGGAYPYTWSLSDAPAGMTINPATGEIRWASPPVSNNPFNVTVRVTDSENNYNSQSYTITVTNSTSRFLFIDDNATGTKTGSITQPYASLSEIWNANHGGKIVYLRNGRYNIPHRNDSIRHASKTNIGVTNPYSYLGYPGETAIIDEEYGKGQEYPAYLFSWRINDVYFENLTFENIYYYALSKTDSDYSTVYNCVFKNAVTDDGHHNQAYINYMAGGSSDYDVIINNTFQGPIGGGSNFQAIETYTVSYMVIDGNTVSNMPNYGIFFKDGTHNSTIRNNKILSCGTGFGQYAQGGSSNIEICFNYICNSVSSDLYIGPVETITNHYVYRNTFVNNGSGAPVFRDNNITSTYVYHNIIVNYKDDTGEIGSNAYYRNKSYYRYVSATTFDKILFTNNIKGTPSQGIINNTGHLMPDYINYLGQYGWQVTASESNVDTNPPSAPSNVSIEVN